MKIFSVYDSKAETFLQPFFAQRTEVAIRNFAYAASNTETDIGRFPTDYTLFEIASWNPDNGTIESLPTAVNHGIAASYIKGK
ncbi:MAG: nonstructural protein [Microvirus sp.]|nr:MAG: nonstructural protein [Microvirus sp.]